MSTLVAMFGYLMAEDEPETWGAAAATGMLAAAPGWLVPAFS
jgi:hypothetical protein